MNSPFIRYHLPKTVVNIEGVVTSKKTYKYNDSLQNDIDGDRIVDNINIEDITLNVVADSYEYYCIDLEKTKISDDTFSLELSDDGRIITTDATSAGKIGTIAKNIAGFVATVVSTSVNLELFSSEDRNEIPISEQKIDSYRKIDLKELYEKKYPKQAKQRRDIIFIAVMVR
jgi:hypothetical protein